jgi:GNAT superfamily N-acetyltransferase
VTAPIDFRDRQTGQREQSRSGSFTLRVNSLTDAVQRLQTSLVQATSHRWACYSAAEVPLQAVVTAMRKGGQMVTRTETTATIRAYEDADHRSVVALFTRINRELAPPDLRERFEDYITASINGELSQLRDIFSEAKSNAFWVVLIDEQVVGMFGIESRGEGSTELRRMYLDRAHRGRGIAQQMLQCAESRARDRGFSKMILSTAEVQEAALAFYGKCGYRIVRTEQAAAMTTKTVGGGIKRFHFEKTL